MTTSSPHRLKTILERLDRDYPDARCALHFQNKYQLLVAVILSAQCTDRVVNTVTPALFERYPDIPSLAAADPQTVERLIYKTGFYRNKTRHLIGMARMVQERFGGEIPSTLEELMELPGVARKTANVVLNVWHNEASGIVVDTHVARISRRLGLTRSRSPDSIARDLEAQIPRDHWIRFSLQLIEHGRNVCVARRPRCERCGLADLCPSAEPTPSRTPEGSR